MELTHQRLVDLTTGEVEAVQITVGGKACRLELIGRRPDFAFCCLRLEKLRRDRDRGLERWRSLFGELAVGLGQP